jgi:hypothetical protein
MFKRVCEAAGVGDGWTPRELRTSFVSLLSHRGLRGVVIGAFGATVWLAWAAGCARVRQRR